jgi:hypothetical protein
MSIKLNSTLKWSGKYNNTTKTPVDFISLYHLRLLWKNIGHRRLLQTS